MRFEVELSCLVIWDGLLFCFWGDIILMLNKIKSKNKSLDYLFIYCVFFVSLKGLIFYLDCI